VDERTITVGEVDLRVAEAGRGGRPFLLVHGFTGAKEDFTEWLDQLAESGWHAVAPDNRGHGSSAKPADEAEYSLDIYVRDVLGLADALGWDRFTLLGHSMGGMIAGLTAATAPDRLDALVLMDTSHGPVEGLDPDLIAAATHIVRTRGMEGLLEAMAEVDSPLTTPADERVRRERPGYIEFGDRKMRDSSPAMYASMIGEIREQADRLDRLRALTMPTLVIVGEQDRPFVGPSERMAEAIPGARLEVLPDAGHSPQFESPDKWWSALSSFLEDVAR
jgi:pimeloyl-ACP methyl ester carboxylesterase